jgi:hypothetical protein
MRLTPAMLILIAFLGALGALIAFSLPELQRYLKIRSM